MTNYLIKPENLRVAAIMESKAKPGMITRESPYKGILFVLAEVSEGDAGYLNFIDEVIDESDVSDFWAYAYENTEFNAVLSDIDTTLGMDVGDVPFPLVLTSECKALGAGSLACENIIRKAIELCGGKAFMLPSSVHEVLFTPANGIELEAATELVREVNLNEVEQDIWLSDRAYLVSIENGKVVVA